MRNHTKGIWEAQGTCVYFPDNQGGFDLRGAPNAEENARRIVACVNAMIGISTEFLEMQVEEAKQAREAKRELRPEPR